MSELTLAFSIKTLSKDSMKQVELRQIHTSSAVIFTQPWSLAMNIDWSKQLPMLIQNVWANYLRTQSQKVVLQAYSLAKLRIDSLLSDYLIEDLSTQHAMSLALTHLTSLFLHSADKIGCCNLISGLNCFAEGFHKGSRFKNGFGV